jgi:hypothetical protein
VAEAARVEPVDRPAPRLQTPGRTERRGLHRAVLISAAVLSVFFAPALLTRAQFLFRDSGRMHLANKAWIAGQWAAGRVPAWNPYAGLGLPVVAGGVDAPLHPFNVLLLVLPFQLGFKAWILLSYLMAALGGFAWARRLGTSQAAALTSGLGLALCGYLVSSSDNAQYLTTMAAVPWMLAATHAYLDRGGPGLLALVGAASFLCASAGDPQAWGFTVLAIAAYRLLIGPRAVPARLGARRTAAAVGAALVGAAPVVLPMLAWLPHSARGEPMDWVEYVRFNLFPPRALEFVIPNLVRPAELDTTSPLFQAFTGDVWTPIPWVLSEYLGAAALALAVLGAVRRREARVLLVLAAVFAWMSMGHYAGFGQLARHVPILGGFRYWEKLAFWPALLVTAAAGFGIDALRARAAPRFALAVGATALLALSLAALVAAVPQPIAVHLARAPESPAAPQLARNAAAGLLHAGAVLSLLAAVVALATRSSRAARALPALAAAIVVTDVAGANVRAYVLSLPEIVQRTSPFADHLKWEETLPRIVTPFTLGHVPLAGLAPHEQEMLWGSRAIYSGWNTEHRIGNFEAYSALVPVRAIRYRRRAGLVKQLPGIGIWGVSHTIVPGRPERAAEMNLPPPYRVVASDPVLDASLLEIRHRPRAYLARELVSVDRRAAMEFVLDDHSIETDRTVLEAPVPAGYAPTPGMARVVVDEPTRVDVRVSAEGSALLVLNDVYAEGWSAAVDGTPSPILPANYLARGVWLPVGDHVVSFRYETPMLREGWLTLAAGALALALSALRARRRPPGDA